MVWLQQEQLTHKTQRNHIEASNLFLIAALLVAVACGNSQPPTQDRSTKVKQRAIDSLLLSFALRFASSFLQSLTASYSSDTVHRLAILGMLWHVLACDYSYANGCVKTGVTNGSRPIFGGGTFSLNEALFSTTLLVSRIHDHQAVFLFISLSVVVFAFYSTTRHEMARTHPANSSGTCDFDAHRLPRRIFSYRLIFSGSLAYYSTGHHGHIVLDFRRPQSCYHVPALQFDIGWSVSSLETFLTTVPSSNKRAVGCSTNRVPCVGYGGMAVK
jgi:hypothetical protein